MAARAGFEPATKWLTATCSATELPSNKGFQNSKIGLSVNADSFDGFTRNQIPSLGWQLSGAPGVSHQACHSLHIFHLQDW